MFARLNITIVILISTACSLTTTKPAELISSLKGLKVTVIQKDLPLLKILLPGQSNNDRGIEIEFPEHVTGINYQTHEVEHLYLITNRSSNIRTLPAWQVKGDTIMYETDLMNRIKMIATATLEQDGVRFGYKFVNHSNVSYANLQAVTCVKLYSIFSDTRLQRTYVHHSTGFELLASETPERLTMPLQTWLPCRYLVSYTWPSPARRIEKDADSVTRYYKSKKADKPFIATVSHDGSWIVATFTKETGNLWTNPERTCQHADPAINLRAGETKSLQLKTFVIQGSLSQLLAVINTEMKQ